jgi:hypothetical protein
MKKRIYFNILLKNHAQKLLKSNYYKDFFKTSKTQCSTWRLINSLNKKWQILIIVMKVKKKNYGNNFKQSKIKYCIKDKKKYI